MAMNFLKPREYVITFASDPRIVGPFKTAEAAAKYAVKQYVASGNYEWRIAPVKPVHR
jgi:hypothetical protein